MALLLEDLMETPTMAAERRKVVIEDGAHEDDAFYDPRGFNRRRRSSVTSRPSPKAHLPSSSPRIDIPGAAQARPTPPSPVRARAAARATHPPELSISPDGPEVSSGSEIETPSQLLGRSIDARLQFDLSPTYGPKATDYFPASPSLGLRAVSEQSAEREDVTPTATLPSETRSTARYDQSILSRRAGASRPVTIDSRASSSSWSGSSSRPPSETFSPAQAYLSSFSRGPSMRELDRAASADVSSEVVHGYAIGKTIGYGGFSSVKQATHLDTGKRVAVKIVQTRPLAAAPSLNRSRTMSTPTSSAHELPLEFPPIDRRPSENQRILVDTEVKIWSRLDYHPHILPLLDLHLTPDASYIFMPYCSGGNLLQYIQEFARRGRRRREQSQSPIGAPHRASSMRRIVSPVHEPDDPPGGGGFDLPHARHIFAQIVDGLRHLHIEAEVTHKDIKLENILLDDMGRFRVADFGLAVSRVPLSHPRGYSEPVDSVRDLSSSWSHGLRPSQLESPTAPSAEEQVDFPLVPEGAAEDFGMVQVDSPLIGGNGSLSRAGSRRERQPVSMLFNKPASPALSAALSDAAGSQPVPSQPAGSLAYAAPELLSPLPAHYTTGAPAVDMWALGCVLYALLDGRLPFTDEYEPRLRVKILDGRWDVPIVLLPHLSKSTTHGDDHVEQANAAAEVLRGLLHPDPLKRWDVEQVRASHWLTTHWTTSVSGESYMQRPRATRSRSRDVADGERRRSSSSQRNGSRGRSTTRAASRERSAPY